MLNKAIMHGKEKRKPFYGSKRFDRSCRNHGSCSYCERSRTHTNKVREFNAKDALREYLER